MFVQDIEGGETVPWICIDPLNPDLNSYPEYFNTTPIKVYLLVNLFT